MCVKSILKLFGLFIFSVSSVYAESSTSTNDPLPYSDLSSSEVNKEIKKISQNKRILQAKIELNQLLEQNNQLRAQSMEKMGQDTSRIEPPSIINQPTHVRSSEPEVVSIEGPKNQLVAMLKMNSGAILRVKAGDSILGWKVLKITKDGVIASNKEGQNKLLPFSLMSSQELSSQIHQ